MKKLILPPEVLEARIAPAAGVLDLGKLDGVNGFQINGEVADDQIAGSVSEIGDFNGDGLADFVIGAESSSLNGALSGGAYVIFGTSHGFPANFDLTSLNGTNGFKILGEAAGDSAGISVSGAGDVNGDGLADLIIGAPGASLNGRIDAGAAYIVFGTASPAATLTLSSFDGEGVKIEGNAADTGFGSVVSGAGDFNGDGFSDVLIGAPTTPGFAGANVPAGACYVIFGGANLTSPISVGSVTSGTGVQISAENLGDFLGISASSAGDVNGDSFDDIIIGATGADSREVDTGAAYVIFGAKGFSGAISLSQLNGTNGFKVTGEHTGDDAGASVTAADLNGDGFSDVVIAAPSAAGSTESSGAVYVVYGKAGTFTTPLSLSSISGGVGLKIQGEVTGDMAGASVKTAGDFNHDGVSDLLIGAPNAAANGDYSGASYLMFGAKTGLGDVLELKNLDGTNGFKIRGVAADDASGSAVSGVGDINGDQYPDFIVGAPGGDGTGEDSGAAYIIYGFDPRVTASADGKTFTFTEGDGDVVTLKLSQAGLLPQDIIFGADGSIESLNLGNFANTEAAQAVGAKALNLLLSAKTPAGGLGNGFTKLGAIFGFGVPMGKVKIGGDLGQIFAGGLGSTAVKSLVVGGDLGKDLGSSALSRLEGAMKTLKVLGSVHNSSFEINGKVRSIFIRHDIGTDTPGMALLADAPAEGAADLVAEGMSSSKASLLAETIGKMKVGGDAKSASIIATKGMGSFSMLGNFQNSSMFSEGNIKAVKVAGKMVSDDPNNPSTITARNKLNVLIVNGDVEHAQILVGYNKDEQPVNPDAHIGRVLVKGDWIASSVVAGVADVTNDGFGRNDAVIAGDTTPDVLSRIASVVIKGNASGSITAGDQYGITAQTIGKLTIAGTGIDLAPDEIDNILLDATNNDFRVVEIG